MPPRQRQPSMQNSPVALVVVEADQEAEEAVAGCMPLAEAEQKDFCAW